MVIGRTDAVVGWYKIRRERREQGRREGMTLAKDKWGDRPEKVKSGGKRGALKMAVSLLRAML